MSLSSLSDSSECTFTPRHLDLSNVMAGNVREELVRRALLAERAQRHEDMATSMQLMASSGVELSCEERDCLVRGYETLLNKRVESWKMVKRVEERSETKGDLTVRQKEICGELRRGIASEIQECANDILKILDENILPKMKDESVRLRLLSKKCSFLRALIEADERQSSQEDLKNCRQLYSSTYKSLQELHKPLDCLRLSHVLGYASFLSAVCNDRKTAEAILQSAYVSGLEATKHSTTTDAHGHALMWDIREELNRLQNP